MSFNSLKTIKNKLGVIALLGLSGSVMADAPVARYDFPEPVTSIGRTALEQHHLTFWICVVIAILVFGVMIYSLFAHRKSKGVTPANFHESTTIEVLWTIVPFLILAVLGVYATKSLITYEDTSGSEMTIKVTGKRWYWVYEYVDGDVPLHQKGKVRFESHIDASHVKASLENQDVSKIKNYLLEVDKPLVVPVNTRIRFLIKSDDVIHAWWVPQFGLKKDAIPGYVNSTWAYVEKEGTYRGQCAELCGRFHAYMPIVVKAVSKTEYQQWYAKASSGADKPKIGSDKTSLMTAGAKIYQQKCAACHQANGAGLPPTFPPLKDSPIVAGPASGHIGIVLNGKGGMPPFKDMSDEELAAVLTYERNSWGNNASVVKPADVKAAR